MGEREEKKGVCLLHRVAHGSVLLVLTSFKWVAWGLCWALYSLCFPTIVSRFNFWYQHSYTMWLCDYVYLRYILVLLMLNINNYLLHTVLHGLASYM